MSITKNIQNSTFSRDAIWEETYKTYYDCFFEELAADELGRRWKITDDITKILVAITTSGSAISGWSLWQDENFKFIWLIIAGLGALLAVVHASLGVPNRLKDWEDYKSKFKSLRIKLDTFMQKMTIFPEFDVKEYFKDFEAYREEFQKISASTGYDILRTKRMANKVQANLNVRIQEASTAKN